MGAHAASHARVRDLVERLGAGPWRLAEVEAAGWTRKQIRWAVDSGKLARPSRGLLAPADVDGEALLVQQCIAALAVAPRGSAVSHATASRLDGLWLPAGADDLIHLTRPGEPDRDDHGMRLHGSALEPRWVDERHGMPVVLTERAAVDTARGHPFAQALVVLDSAARTMAIADCGDKDVLRDPESRAPVIERARERLVLAHRSVFGWPGTRVVAAALPHVDPCSESPFESSSRGHILRSHLPAPELAVPLRGASGKRYYADFLWRRYRLIGEADGWAKYKEGTAARELLRAERERQRDLEAAGWRFVRWDPADPPRAVIARIAAALGLA
jgi:hypothetical protein